MTKKIKVEREDGWHVLSINTGMVNTSLKLADDSVVDLVERLAETYPDKLALPESEGQIVECPACGVQASYQEAISANCRVVCNDCETDMRPVDIDDE